MHSKNIAEFLHFIEIITPFKEDFQYIFLSTQQFHNFISQLCRCKYRKSIEIVLKITHYQFRMFL